MATEARTLKLAQEKIIEGFNQLRGEQRNLSMKLFEFESDLNEHEMVLKTLQKVKPDQRCFRMVGDTLVERTVNEVLPAVEQNRDQLSKLIQEYNQKIVDKGKEINEYRDQYGIQIRREGAPQGQPEKSAAKKPEPSVLVEEK